MTNDGVPLINISHPRGKKTRLRGISKDSIETIEIELPVYANAGETITCENGHPICDFVETVGIGATQNLPQQLGNWRQPTPQIGQSPIPRCTVCGARWAIPGGIFHIGKEWRDPHGYIAKYGMPED